MSHHSTYIFLYKLTCAISLLGLCAIVFQMNNGSNVEWRRTWILKARAIKTLDGATSRLKSMLQGVQGTEDDTPKVVIFNVLPKSGSRTLDSLLAKLDKNITMLNTMNGINETKEDKFAIIRRAIRSNRTTFVYSHTRYRWMGPYGPAHGVRRPIYITVVRDPIERLASLYYFVRHGDNNVDRTEAAYQFREIMKARNYSNETFDECILRHNRGCRNPGAFVRHFSGYNRNGTSVKRALTSINRHYTVVGIMEDYESFLKVLERKIPEIFDGIVALYREEKNSIVTSMKTKNKRVVSPSIKNILREEMVGDYEVYDMVKSKFEELKYDLYIR